MKNIFTYPNNASTNYIDPLYDGADNTEGLNKRVDELRTGTYKNWNSYSPPLTTEQMMTGFSKYINHVDNYNQGNIKIYDFWVADLIEMDLRDAGYTMNNVGAERSPNGGYATIRLNCSNDANHDLQDGDQIQVRGLVDTGGYDFDTLNGTHYVKVIVASDEVELYNDSACTDPVDLDGFMVNQDDWHALSHNGGTKVWFDTPFNETFVDGDGVVVTEQMTGITGTANPAVDSTLYLDKIATNHYEVFTDSALTTAATITNESYSSEIESFTVYDSGDGAGNYTQQNHSASGAGNADLRTFFTTKGIPHPTASNKYWGFARMFVQTGGTGTYIAGNKTIPTSLGDTAYFVWEYDNSAEQYTIMTDITRPAGSQWRPNGTALTWSFTGSFDGTTNYVRTQLRLVDTTHLRARNDGGTGNWFGGEIQQAITAGKYGLNPIADGSGNAYYVADHFNVFTPGNRIYKQRTGESTYAFNVEFVPQYWKAGDTAPTDVSSPEVTPTPTFTGNASYFMNAQPTLPTEAQKGKFTASDSRVMRTRTVADTYTPPALSTEAQEDVWDTDNEWDNTQYSGLKTFPTTVTPSSVTVRTISPSATSQSQNGTKYTRTAGYSKYSLDVVYPAMTAEQYLDYNGFISALNGQKHPFYFNIIQNGTRMLGREEDSDYGIAGLRFKDDASAGDNIVLIEGFAGNQSNAVKRGELMVVDNKHGNIKTVGSSTDANVYGEAKFRFTTPMHNDHYAAERIYNDPFHIIVSLDTSTVEVNRDTAGFYYLTMSFTADEWK